MLEKAGEAPPQTETSREARLDADYAAVEAVLLDSVRGRWFLAEYARRNRAADTEMLLDAIAKLEMAVLRPQRRHQDLMLGELVEMSEAIARTRREIAAIKPPNQLLAATEELDDIVEATEKATSEILQAAEEIQEVGWILREKGAEPGLCDTLDQRATDIYTACSFQDITGQRTEKVVKVLRFIEQRINAMIEIWGAEEIDVRIDSLERLARAGGLLNGPQRDGTGLMQGDIDAMLTLGETGVETAREARTVEAAAPASRPASAPDAGLSRPLPYRFLDQAGQPSGEGPSPATAVEAQKFEPPEPLLLAKLHSAKREALFG
jgi:chemotaxis protein CheZ